MKYNPFSLHNKTILVTGASSGIGRAIAIECSKMGATLIITGRNPERLNNTFVCLEGLNHLKVIADFDVLDQTEALIEQLPVLDGIVHCAGIVITLPFQFISEEKLGKIFSINFINPTLITQQMIKRKKINRDASIVWISSIAGYLCSSPGGSMYSASKGAINGMVKGMAIDLAGKGIRVNSINPGVIDTNIFEAEVITQEQMQDDVKKYPLKRHGKTEDVAYAAIYLLSKASQWVTGSHLVVDGGYTAL